MPFFNLNKKDDKELSPTAPPSAPPTDTPTDKVSDLKKEGLSNDKVVQNLEENDYSPTQVSNAMEQSSMTPASNPELGPLPFEEGGGFDVSEDRIEEIVEAIIEEKWNELVKNVNKIIGWKERTESKVLQLEQKFTDLKADFDNLHSAVLGKVGEYDQNLTNIGADIKAMEKVFQKLLPTFTENINELSRVTKEMKKESSKK